MMHGQPFTGLDLRRSNAGFCSLVAPTYSAAGCGRGTHEPRSWGLDLRQSVIVDQLRYLEVLGGIFLLTLRVTATRHDRLSRGCKRVARGPLRAREAAWEADSAQVLVRLHGDQRQ